MGWLWQYNMIGNLSNRNAGYSMWGFAKKDGKDFFVKQFLSPKYPVNDTQSSPARIRRKMDICDKFVQQKQKIYSVVNAESDGNDVRIQELFRVDSKFYIAMEKIEALPWTIQTVCDLDIDEKRRLCAIIAHGIAALHHGGLIHADVKHENILFTKTPTGTITAKITDFDSAFLETEPLDENEEIVGDWVYFSPEAWNKINGEPANLTCKMDVFALGVLFHQYFAGTLPLFDTENCSAAGQALHMGLEVRVAEGLPQDLTELLQQMLSKDPDDRPTADEVFRRIRTLPDEAADVTGGAEETVVRFCWRCGTRLLGGATLCDSCADELRSSSEKGADSPETRGGDFFFRPSGL